MQLKISEAVIILEKKHPGIKIDVYDLTYTKKGGKKKYPLSSLAKRSDRTKTIVDYIIDNNKYLKKGPDEPTCYG